MLSKNIISIDIGTATTKLVVGSYKGSKINILHMASVATPLNAINDGQVIDLNKIKDLIKKELNHIKIKTKKVVFTLDSTSIITRELTLPYAKNEELQKILSFEIGQYFPIDLEEYVIQSKKLEDFEEDRVKKSRVLVAAIPKLIVKTYFELATALDLEPFALDAHFNAVSKLFENKLNINQDSFNKNKTVAMIDLGYDNINIHIIDQGILRFNRLLTVGGKEINLNIANNFNFSFNQAEKIKIEQNTWKDENASPLYFSIEEVMKGSMDHWVEEIQRIFKFYTSRSPENKIDQLYLYGGHSNLKNIMKHFEVALDIPAEIINNISGIYIKNTDIKDISITTFLNAISALIRR